MKQTIFIALGAAGGMVSSVFGGWNAALTTLVIFMGCDYLSGVIAALFCRSDKSESGGLSSRAGWKGILKKIMTLIVIMLAARLSMAVDTPFIKDAAVVAFICNEALSILENAAVTGVPIPSIILRAIDALEQKGEGKA